MATKTFNTRIRNKIDTFANWTKNDPVLLNGEIGIVVVLVGHGSCSSLLDFGAGPSASA